MSGSNSQNNLNTLLGFSASGIALIKLNKNSENDKHATKNKEDIETNTEEITKTETLINENFTDEKFNEIITTDIEKEKVEIINNLETELLPIIFEPYEKSQEQNGEEINKEINRAKAAEKENDDKLTNQIGKFENDKDKNQNLVDDLVLNEKGENYIETITKSLEEEKRRSKSWNDEFSGNGNTVFNTAMENCVQINQTNKSPIYPLTTNGWLWRNTGGELFIVTTGEEYNNSFFKSSKAPNILATVYNPTKQGYQVYNVKKGYLDLTNNISLLTFNENQNTDELTQKGFTLEDQTNLIKNGDPCFTIGSFNRLFNNFSLSYGIVKNNNNFVTGKECVLIDSIPNIVGSLGSPFLNKEGKLVGMQQIATLNGSSLITKTGKSQGEQFFEDCIIESIQFLQGGDITPNDAYIGNIDPGKNYLALSLSRDEEFIFNGIENAEINISTDHLGSLPSGDNNKIYTVKEDWTEMIYQFGALVDFDAGFYRTKISQVVHYDSSSNSYPSFWSHNLPDVVNTQFDFQVNESGVIIDLKIYEESNLGNYLYKNPNVFYFYIADDKAISEIDKMGGSVIGEPKIWGDVDNFIIVDPNFGLMSPSNVLINPNFNSIFGISDQPVSKKIVNFKDFSYSKNIDVLIEYDEYNDYGDRIVLNDNVLTITDSTSNDSANDTTTINFNSYAYFSCNTDDRFDILYDEDDFTGKINRGSFGISSSMIEKSISNMLSPIPILNFNLTGRYIKPTDLNPQQIMPMNDKDGYLNAEKPLSYTLNDKELSSYHYGGLLIENKNCIILRVSYRPIGETNKISHPIGIYNPDCKTISSIISSIKDSNKDSLEFHVLKPESNNRLTPRILSFHPHNRETINIYVHSIGESEPYYNFYLKPEDEGSHQPLVLSSYQFDVAHNYRFLRLHKKTDHPFTIQGSYPGVTIDGDDKVFGEKTFTVSFDSSFNLATTPSLIWYCSDHSAMTGTFNLKGYPIQTGKGYWGEENTLDTNTDFYEYENSFYGPKELQLNTEIF